jgi:hypothetical protein
VGWGLLRASLNERGVRAPICVAHDRITSGGSLKTEIYTKNSEDTDGSVTRVDPNAGGTGLTQTSDGTVDGTFEGFEELVRAKFELSRVSGTVPVACHFRILSPSWLTN